ncbi:hypothetical protein ZHAS_00006483 [Anopheles sinensis]|uniref:KASH domain-containing protein n=1 Tax=Anopheles sinensis TaxID=74873 RepID=A0A084VLY0_ANOSI|nr:hypothetical protein ZHAS_00006483 [Anopheles sinensis]
MEKERRGEIYREIKSNSRAVAACIRSFERDRKSASTASGKGSRTPEVEASLGSSNTNSGHSSSTVGGSAAGSVTAGGGECSKGKENGGGGGVKGLERRYHLLYLKAFEIQCLLEGLLDSKTSSSDNNASLSDTDEEPANKLARVSTSSIKSEGSIHNETLSNEEWVKVKKLSNAGFDADSEGSDSEIVPKIIAYSGTGNAYNSNSNNQQQENQFIFPVPGGSNSSSGLATTKLSPSSGNFMMEADINNLSIGTIISDETTLTTTSSSAKQAAAEEVAAVLLKENILNNNNNASIESAKSVGFDMVDGTPALLSSTLDTVNNNGTVVNGVSKDLNTDANGVASPRELVSPPKLKSNSAKGLQKVKGSAASHKQKRSKVSDSSKFNRSNRKSKNCATFYFKHLETDSELNKDSSERTKSDESSAGTSSATASSSEGDDEWVYNNGSGEEGDEQSSRQREKNALNKSSNLGDGEEEKENKPDTIENLNKEELGNGALPSGQPKSKKCLDFSREDAKRGSTPAGGRNGGGRSLMMTSIGSFGKSTDTSANGGGKGAKVSHGISIQRLVLHAETLVRDEILAKNAVAAAAAAAAAGGGSTPKTVVKNPHYYHHHHHHHHHNYSSSNNSGSSHHHQQQQTSSSLPSLSGVAALGVMGPIAQHEPHSRHGAKAQSQHHHHHHHHGHGRKAEKAMSNLKMNLIEEWLEKQPLDAPVAAPILPASVPTTDCEASGEYTDSSDSITRDTDSSEGLANSVATCLQGEQTQTSQEVLNDGTSYPSENSNDDEGVATDSKGGSSTAMATALSSPSLPATVAGGSSTVTTVVKRRPHRSAADRPWSVSCMSQLNSSTVEINQYGGGSGELTEGATNGNHPVNGGGQGDINGAGGGAGNGGQSAIMSSSSPSGGNGRPLTDHRNFSISESALNTMAARGAGGIVSGSSMVGSRGSMKPTSSQQTVVRNSESKGSLKKRKLRPRRKNRIDESGSDESQPPHHSSSTLHLLQLLQYNALTGASGHPLREIQLSGTGGSNSSGGAGVAVGSVTGSRRLLKSESFSGRLRLSDDLLTLSSLSGSSSRKSSSVRPTTTRSTKKSQDSEEEFGGCTMAKPEFRIGSLTRPRCGSLNLGSLAALANYNLDGVEKIEADLNGTGTGTEEMSSFSEQAWDNYQEKYMSEPYSEDRDTDAARRLLDFGDDYRNFIDSQSDCASSSLSAANMDSMSPPRFRHKSESANKSDANTNSLNRRKRLDEYRMDDRYGNNMNSWSSKSGSPPQSTTNVGGRKHGSLAFLDATPLATMPESIAGGSASIVGGGNGSGGGGGGGGGARRRSLRSVDKHNSAAFVRSVSHETSSSSNNEFDEDMEAGVKKLLVQNKIRFANTEALKAKCHLLKPDDYSEIISTCRENVRCLESVLRCQPGTVLTAAKCQDLRDTIVCWEGLLDWSERRVISNQFLADIQLLKGVLEELGSKTFNICSESHIQLAIDQLKNEHKVLQNQRPKMLTLNATVHNWVSNQEQQRKELLDPSVDARLEQLERDKNFVRCVGGRCGECYDCLNDIRLDTSVNRELKDGITTLYGTWDEAEVRIRNRIENLTTSMMTWKQLEDGLSDFRDILDRDRGKLQGIEGALQSGGGATEEIVKSVKEVVKALSEKVDPLFHEQQRQQQQQEHQLLAACVKLSSNGSLSDSGISDGGGMSDGSLSERERRLSALKRLVKQLEVALAPGSDAMQTITKRLEMAEHDLRSLQSTCRKIIMNEKNHQEQLQLQQRDRSAAASAPQGKDASDGNNNNNVSVKNKNKKSPSRKKNRNRSPGNGASSGTSADVTEAEDDAEQLLQLQSQEQSELQREHLLSLQKSAQLGIVQTTKMKLSQNRWVWRITKIAVPVQLALVLVMCAACFFEPHCCDALNTYTMSFTPQLRYMKGPPPI